MLKATNIPAFSLGHCFFNKTSVYEGSINFVCRDNFTADVVNCVGILRWPEVYPNSRVRASCLFPLNFPCLSIIPLFSPLETFPLIVGVMKAKLVSSAFSSTLDGNLDPTYAGIGNLHPCHLRAGVEHKHI